MLSSTAQSGGLLPWLIQAGLTFRAGPDPDGFQAAIVGKPGLWSSRTCSDRDLAVLTAF